MPMPTIKVRDLVLSTEWGTTLLMQVPLLSSDKVCYWLEWEQNRALTFSSRLCSL